MHEIGFISGIDCQTYFISQAWSENKIGRNWFPVFIRRVISRKIFATKLEIQDMDLLGSNLETEFLTSFFPLFFGVESIT
jgi:hypothetical protein